ncbi:hypothetical protein DSO57_1010229 [Entomophthora muscae]|uniref:Uncharacterized protein n=1 Tax=Entomophthora muscae TaxID=34485 RepID=A0ACC2RXM9_9FUNG|nr:hypothetical protein DSO57_1010229 [Entomophthora muscae]
MFRLSRFLLSQQVIKLLYEHVLEYGIPTHKFLTLTYSKITEPPGCLKDHPLAAQATEQNAVALESCPAATQQSLLSNPHTKQDTDQSNSEQAPANL